MRIRSNPFVLYCKSDCTRRIEIERELSRGCCCFPIKVLLNIRHCKFVYTQNAFTAGIKKYKVISSKVGHNAVKFLVIFSKTKRKNLKNIGHFFFMLQSRSVGDLNFSPQIVSVVTFP